jgi:uncharacterized protein
MGNLVVQRKDTIIRDLTPVTERERHFNLDAIRGFAVCGILIANMLSYAFPVSTSAEWGWQDALGIDFVLIAAVSIFVSGKFYSLFAILFGMGIAIQNRRTGFNNRSFARLFTRRMAILLVIGISHAALLWSGDILGFYTLIGLVAFLFRNQTAKNLLASAMVMFLISIVVLTACSVLAPSVMPDRWFGWEERAEQLRHLGAANTNQATERTGANLVWTGPDDELEYYDLLADEERIFRSGAWMEMVSHRSVFYFMIAMPLKLLFRSAITLALFLLGMYLATAGLFTSEEFTERFCRKLIGYGLGIGIVLQLSALGIEGLTQLSSGYFLIQLAFTYLGNALLGLGYATTLVLICKRVRLRQLFRPLACIGRLALTNYIAQSLIGGFIFYSYGLGLFGRLELAYVLLLVLPIWSAQATYSMIWMSRYRFGPLEWVWRSLAYGQIFRLRRVE